MVTPSYPANIGRLLQMRRSMPLGPGAPAPEAEEHLDAALLERLFGGRIIADKTSARLCQAGLWLLYDHLDQCHRIAQSVEAPDGNYWHAVMHRREGDFSNSKYWYRRVGEHEVLRSLAEEARPLAEGHERLAAAVSAGLWNPFSFVDACGEAVRGAAALEGPCRQVQQIEWELLFAHCFRKAVGENR